MGIPGPNVVDMQKMIPAILHDGATPAQVFLYTGVGPVNSTTELTTIFTNYKNTVAKILELSPTTRVTLMSLQPTTTAATNTDRVVPFNALLKGMLMRAPPTMWSISISTPTSSPRQAWPTPPTSQATTSMVRAT